jgi:hypothetical protein
LEHRDPVSRDGSRDALEPSIGGPAGRERDLLLQDDLNEGAEARRPVPERRRAVARDHRGKMPVSLGELGHPLGEGFDSQLRAHVYRTRLTRCL